MKYASLFQHFKSLIQRLHIRCTRTLPYLGIAFFLDLGLHDVWVVTGLEDGVGVPSEGKELLVVGRLHVDGVGLVLGDKVVGVEGDATLTWKSNRSNRLQSSISMGS